MFFLVSLTFWNSDVTVSEILYCFWRNAALAELTKKEVTPHGEIWISSFSKTTESLQASFLYRTTLNEIIDPHRSQQFQKPGFFFLALPKNELTKCKQRKIARGNIRNKDRPTEKIEQLLSFCKKNYVLNVNHVHIDSM